MSIRRIFNATPLCFESWSSSVVVQPIAFLEAAGFVRQHHYARGIHNGPTLCCGLYNGPRLIGVCAFATPCSEAVRSSVFGQDRKATVTELHRLVILDETPTNAESWFIARSLAFLRQLKSHIEAVVSFADEGRGHRGVIYQASNALYYGAARGEHAYQDAEGRLRHRRQCGHNVTLTEAQDRGWTPASTGRKHRYCLLLGRDRRHSRQLLGDVRLERYDYPKPLGVTNGAGIAHPVT
ncbi:hypothetical protein [Armatimonas sp.]|uniref:Mom family adenine methylcarbamoylation protein n=1 Tax=Armatimonas sp. TaxID=1872638 RepID=UPI00374DB1E9